jgi:hypothetical protein
VHGPEADAGGRQRRHARRLRLVRMRVARNRSAVEIHIDRHVRKLFPIVRARRTPENICRGTRHAFDSPPPKNSKIGVV